MQTNNADRFFTTMILNCKYVNENYLKDEKYIPDSTNIRNKKYIDDWMQRNYQSLYNKFNRNDDRMTKKGFSKTDIMHESILRIYINPRRFKNQEECNDYLNNFFHVQTI